MLDDSLAEPPGNIPVFRLRAVNEPSILRADTGRRFRAGTLSFLTRLAVNGRERVGRRVLVSNEPRGVPALARVTVMRGETVCRGVSIVQQFHNTTNLSEATETRPLTPRLR